MDLYQLTFAVLVITSCWLAWTHHKHELKAPPSREATLEGSVLETHGDPKQFRRIFIPVYLLVMGSDWLQVLLLLSKCMLKRLTILTGSVCLHALQRRKEPRRVRCCGFVHLRIPLRRYLCPLRGLPSRQIWPTTRMSCLLRRIRHRMSDEDLRRCHHTIYRKATGRIEHDANVQCF